MRRTCRVLVGPILLLALAACSQNAASYPSTATAPSSTATAQPTLTPTRRSTRTPAVPIATPTETQTPQPDWGKTPPASVEYYRLAPWSAEAALALLDSEASLVFPKDPEGRLDDDWTVARLALLREVASSGTATARRDEARRRLALPGSYGWNEPVPVEPFRAMFAEALNSATDVSFSPKALSDLVAAAVGDDAIQVLDVIAADNVLADGAEGWILVVRDSVNVAATLVVAGRPGDYRVVSPRAEWDRFAWSDQSVIGTDWNRDGVPEIALTERHWGVGMTHYCGESLWVYQWDGAGFANLTPDLVLNLNTDSANCISFAPVDPTSSGPVVLQGGYSVAVGCGLWGDEQSVQPRWLRRYGWDGETFSLISESFEPLERSLTDTAAWPACLLSWVNEAGADNDQAYALLPLILADTDPARVAQAVEWFGPAYVDFFSFKLGVWHAQRGHSSEAVALLTQVRDAPTRPDYHQASRLAVAFLEGYRSRGVYTGCVAASAAIDFTPYAAPMAADYPYDLEAMRSAWGFADFQWAAGQGSGWNGPGVRGDVRHVCDLVTAFRRGLSTQPITDTAGLTRWLKDQGIPVTGFLEADLNDDGRRDWLGLFGTGEEQAWHLWVILNRPGGPEPLWVADVFRRTANIPAAWGVFHPTPEGRPVHLYQWTDGQILFRVASDGQPAGVEVLRRSIGYFDGEHPLGFAVTPNDAAASDGSERLRLVITGAESWESTWYELDWVERSHTLQIVDSPELAQNRRIAQAETLLYVEGDPSGAAAELDALLALGNPIVDVNADRGWSAPRVRPYLLYLQGLAHAQAGDTAEAVTAFWNLWDDYPFHPLAYLAAQRLKP